MPPTRTARATTPRAATASAVLDEHRAILDAVRAGDAATANDVLRSHRERAVAALEGELAG